MELATLSSIFTMQLLLSPATFNCQFCYRARILRFDFEQGSWRRGARAASLRLLLQIEVKLSREFC